MHLQACAGSCLTVILVARSYVPPLAPLPPSKDFRHARCAFCFLPQRLLMDPDACLMLAEFQMQNFPNNSPEKWAFPPQFGQAP